MRGGEGWEAVLECSAPEAGTYRKKGCKQERLKFGRRETVKAEGRLQ